MCLRPVKIFNQTYSYRSSDCTTLLCPCGECEECRTIRQCEYTFRIYEEMRLRNEEGYNIYFVTLTYNDFCLPTDNIRTHFGKKANIRCFRRSDVSKFFTRLRKYLYQKYGIKSISYCCASEYGKSTQRPHYHAMIAIPRYGKLLHCSVGCNQSCPLIGARVELTSEKIHSLVQELWTYGFIFPRFYTGGSDAKGYVHKAFQVDPKNLRPASLYIAKYCCKDLSFYGLPEVQNYESICDSFIKSDVSDDVKLFWKRKKREHLTFVITSNHFGIGIEQLIKSPEDLVNGVSSTFNPSKLIPVPTYNRNHLIYNVRTVKSDPTIRVAYSSSDGKVKYKYKCKRDLTDFGKAVLKCELKSRINSTCDSLKEFLEYTVTDRKFIDWYKNLFGSEPTFVALKNKIYDLSVYMNVYRNRVSTRHVQNYLDDENCFIESRTRTTFIESFHPITHQLITRIGQEEYYVETDGVFDNPIDVKWTDSNIIQFSGSEDLETMTQNFGIFYAQNLNFDRYKYEDTNLVKKLAVEKKVHFNNFSCFAGFDDFIEVFIEYSRVLKTPVYKTRAQRKASIQAYKQAFTEVDY